MNIPNKTVCGVKVGNLKSPENNCLTVSINMENRCKGVSSSKLQNQQRKDTSDPKIKKKKKIKRICSFPWQHVDGSPVYVIILEQILKVRIKRKFNFYG